MFSHNVEINNKGRPIWLNFLLSLLPFLFLLSLLPFLFLLSLLPFLFLLSLLPFLLFHVGPKRFLCVSVFSFFFSSPVSGSGPI